MPTPPHETPFDRYRAKHKLGTSTPTEAALFNAGYSEGLADGTAMASEAQAELDRKASELAAERAAWETERDRTKAELDAREGTLNARAASALPPQPLPIGSPVPEPAKGSFLSKALVVVITALLVILLGGVMLWFAWPSIKSTQTQIANDAAAQGAQTVNASTNTTVSQAVTDINRYTGTAVTTACSLPAMALDCQTLVDQANSKDPSIRAQAQERGPEVRACKAILGLMPVKVITPPAPAAKPVPVVPPANLKPGHPVAPLVTPGMYFK